jgi:hypothetical protein
MSTAETNSTSHQTTSAQNRPSASAIDPQKLADKVYRLMQADIRLERARGMSTTRRREMKP